MRVSREMGFDDTYLVLLTPVALEIAPGNLVHSICSHPGGVNAAYREDRLDGLAT